MKFKTRFSEHERFYADPGKDFHNTYAVQIDEKGVKELVVTGEVYLPDEINSHAESVDIHNILARFNNGETEVLTKRVGDYFDASILPSNLADMYRTVANGEDMFNKLPVDVRAKFNHSFTEFVSSIGSPEFVEVFAPSKVADVKESEVADES